MTRGDKKPETPFRRCVDIVMVLVYNTVVFSCVILALWFALFLVSLLLPEDGPIVDAVKAIASASVIILYIIYSVRDIILYIRKSMRKF